MRVLPPNPPLCLDKNCAESCGIWEAKSFVLDGASHAPAHERLRRAPRFIYFVHGLNTTSLPLCTYDAMHRKAEVADLYARVWNGVRSLPEALPDVTALVTPQK